MHFNTQIKDNVPFVPEPRQTQRRVTSLAVSILLFIGDRCIEDKKNKDRFQTNCSRYQYKIHVYTFKIRSVFNFQLRASESSLLQSGVPNLGFKNTV